VLVADTSVHGSTAEIATRLAASLAAAGPDVDVRPVAGEVTPEDWSKGGIKFFQLFGGTFGDHRDWDDVDRWATGIGRALTSGDART